MSLVMVPLIIGLEVVLVVVAVHFWKKARNAQRERFIHSYMFPRGIDDKLRQMHPTLDAKQFQLIARALRQFFMAHLKSDHGFVAMPSQAADDLWHEFILYTRNYEAFCKQAFGGFMHHTPAVALGADRRNNTGLRRVWWFACKEENINPRHATRLPLLFALDSKLGLANGFSYALDCKAATTGQTPVPYCGGDLGGETSSYSFESSGCGGGSVDSSSSDGGGSDGGGGCGGGCGGGGGD